MTAHDALVADHKPNPRLASALEAVGRSIDGLHNIADLARSEVTEMLDQTLPSGGPEDVRSAYDTVLQVVEVLEKTREFIELAIHHIQTRHHEAAEPCNGLRRRLRHELGRAMIDRDLELQRVLDRANMLGLELPTRH